MTTSFYALNQCYLVYEAILLCWRPMRKARKMKAFSGPCSHFNIKLLGFCCLVVYVYNLGIFKKNSDSSKYNFMQKSNRYILINIHLNIPRQTMQYFNLLISFSSWTRNNQYYMYIYTAYVCVYNKYGQCNILLKEYILKKDKVFLVSQ